MNKSTEAGNNRGRCVQGCFIENLREGVHVISAVKETSKNRGQVSFLEFKLYHERAVESSDSFFLEQ